MSFEKPNINYDANINPEIQEFLGDGSGLDQKEAQHLTEVFEKNKGEIINIHKAELDMLRKELGNISKVAAVSDREKRKIKEIAEKKDNVVPPPKVKKVVSTKKQTKIGPGKGKRFKERVTLSEDRPVQETNESVIGSGEGKNDRVVVERIPGSQTYETIRGDSKNMPKEQIMALQLMCGFTLGNGVDGDFGPKTFKEYSKENQEWADMSLIDYIQEHQSKIDQYVQFMSGDIVSEEMATALFGSEVFDKKGGQDLLDMVRSSTPPYLVMNSRVSRFAGTPKKTTWKLIGENFVDAAITYGVKVPKNRLEKESKLVAEHEGGNTCNIVRPYMFNGGGGNDVGCFQINTINIPELKAKGIVSSAADLLDPVKNAQAAGYLYAKNGWDIWYGAKRAGLV